MKLHDLKKELDKLERENMEEVIDHLYEAIQSNQVATVTALVYYKNGEYQVYSPYDHDKHKMMGILMEMIQNIMWEESEDQYNYVDE